MIDYLLSVPWYGLIYFIFCFAVILEGWLSVFEPEEKTIYSDHNYDALRYGIMMKKRKEEEKNNLENHILNIYSKVVYNSNIFNTKKRRLKK